MKNKELQFHNSWRVKLKTKSPSIDGKRMMWGSKAHKAWLESIKAVDPVIRAAMDTDFGDDEAAARSAMQKLNSQFPYIWDVANEKWAFI